MERPAFLRQLQDARPTFEQAQGEAGLQLRNAAGQRRLWTSGGACSPAEAAVLGDEVEIGEGEEVHAFHQRDGPSYQEAYWIASGSIIFQVSFEAKLELPP